MKKPDGKLYRLIKERGYKNAQAFCNKHRLNTSRIGGYDKLTVSPFDKNGRYKKECSRLADILLVDVEKLFPLKSKTKDDFKIISESSFEHLALQEIAGISDSLDLDAIVDATDLTRCIQFILGTLNSPKQAKIVQLHFFYGYTLNEIGEFFNVSRERIRQIEAVAIRRLRHHSRKKKLRECLDGWIL